MTEKPKPILYQFGAGGALSLEGYIEQRHREAAKLRAQKDALELRAATIEQEVRALCDVLKRVTEVSE